MLLLAPFSAPSTIEPDKDLSPIIKSLTQSPDPKVRARSARDLEKLGLAARPAARALCGAMLDPSPSVRTAAESALEKVDSRVYWPVRALLARPEESTHAKAIAALAKLQDESKAAVPVLLYHLLVTVHEYRLATIKGLQSRWESALRRERARLTDADSIEAMLEKLIEQVVNEVQARSDQEEFEDLRERRNRLPLLIHADMKALAEIAGEEGIVQKSLASLLKSPEPEFRKDALGILGQLGDLRANLRAALVPRIRQSLSDPAPEIRHQAVQVLSSYGNDAKSALPLLRKMRSRDPSDNVRREAARAIEKIAGS
jgi:HEAT repeat protein